MDSRLGALVIEYKHHTKLASMKDQLSASKQISEYMVTLCDESNQQVIGFVTDGFRAKFITNSPLTGSSSTSFDELSEVHIERLIRSIVLLEKTALTPENLVKDFCSENGVASNLSKILFEALTKKICDRSMMLFNEWKALFKLAHDDTSKQAAIEERRESLATSLNITINAGDNETEYKALYAIQTAYAIIVKIIAYKVITAVRSENSIISFSELATANADGIRTHLYRLEEGAIFRDIGFGNLLEGDFFAWYCTEKQWNSDIAECVKQVFSVLTEYEDNKIFSGEDVHIQDLFKDLYMHVIPDKVRHSLGEFYTPPWLADNLVKRAVEMAGTNGWKGLDPCCGSGTFVTVLMRRVLNDVKGKSRKSKLKAVLNRVKGIDLNPLAVLTSRINYFINISHLVGDDDEFEIPIYLGDSSYVPVHEMLGKVDCLSYEIQTIRAPIKITLPVSATNDSQLFSKSMTDIELHIKNQDEGNVAAILLELVKKSERTSEVTSSIKDLAFQLVELERNDWNGIWARIITNFLTTANIGKFELVVGNPPWIDWKNLPANYRERIKSLCIDHNMFSGDGITGGINLNVCALITNVAADNWLSNGGVLAFLMPENMIFQQSYEGFRKLQLSMGDRLYFQEFYDWTRSGHPFKPVQHKFLTYFLSSKVNDYSKGVPVTQFVKKTKSEKGKVISLSECRNVMNYDDVSDLFDMVGRKALVPSKKNTSFAYADSASDVASYKKISGDSVYPGREGVEFYPQELFLLHLKDRRSKVGEVFVDNYQNKKSKHKIAAATRLLETKYLYPLVKGSSIERFYVPPSEYYVPFPYDKNYEKGRKPVSKSTLSKNSPKLMKYFNDNKNVIEIQTNYNDRIIGKNNNSEFYAIARVGEYSHADCYVAFRDNTKWQAAVVEPVVTPWGEKKHPVFQNHAVTICEKPSGGFISMDEAHYICAILNAPVVCRFMMSSSDSRSFKIRPPIAIPEYDAENEKHIALSNLSKMAHTCHKDEVKMQEIDTELDAAYLALFKRK